MKESAVLSCLNHIMDGEAFNLCWTLWDGDGEEERERDAFCVPAWEFPNLMQLEAAAMAVSRAPCIVMEVRCNCMSTRATVWQPKRTFSASFISFLLIWSLMNVIRINHVFPCEIMKCRMLMHKLLRKSKKNGLINSIYIYTVYKDDPRARCHTPQKPQPSCF